MPRRHLTLALDLDLPLGLEGAGQAAEAAAPEVTGHKTYADLLEALDARHEDSAADEDVLDQTSISFWPSAFCAAV